MSPDQQTLDEGDVASFVFLHLKTARYIRPHEWKKDHLLYEVEGKERPMIVIRRLGPPTHPEKCEYEVLRLTTKGENEKGEKKPRHEPVGRLAGDCANSFVVLELERYPAALLAPHGTKRKLTRDTLGALIRLLAAKGIRGPTFGLIDE